MKNPNTYQKTSFNEYNIAEVYFRNDTVEIFCKEFITVKSTDLKLFLKQLKKDIPKNKPLKFILYIQPTTVFEIETRQLFLKTLKSNFKAAEAIVTENISQQFILETMLDRTTPSIPVKIFNSREDAVKWLRTLTKE
jgi:hypothetical protein